MYVILTWHWPIFGGLLDEHLQYVRVMPGLSVSAWLLSCCCCYINSSNKWKLGLRYFSYYGIHFQNLKCLYQVELYLCVEKNIIQGCASLSLLILSAGVLDRSRRCKSLHLSLAARVHWLRPGSVIFIIWQCFVFEGLHWQANKS